ncbi:alpha/beta fold hydrolase [Herbiconiux daphne]|uniref:Alpha/beta hydrolase n=1 Tax=Herbiconiux daphne TaxID=2970914 RepID=A0ABT2H7I7_9MICO|nr:alpha/beta hydrolase [Herbiconiux daphne]MCS5735899.1 alpha/beta hydrolase [Herbiconiux daphne]
MTTVILVHGAFAGSDSWNGVIAALHPEQRVIAYANPLRGIDDDVAPLNDLIRTIDGPIVLVGHSYGGAVLTAVDPSAAQIVGLVYVAGFALQTGESPATASALAPGSTLADTLVEVPLQGGGVDLYIDQDEYWKQFCADLSEQQAGSMAVTQRPVTGAGLNDPLKTPALWQSVPSWFVFGENDRNIPAAAHHVMADRAGARRTVEVAGASHVVGISHPGEVVTMVMEAASSPR